MRKSNIKDQLAPILRKKLSAISEIEETIKKQKAQISEILNELEDESQNDSLLKYDFGKKTVGKIIRKSNKTFNFGIAELKILQKKFKDTLK